VPVDRHQRVGYEGEDVARRCDRDQGGRRLRDPETVCQQAHTLKGASSTVGAVRLTTVCEELEQAGRAGDLERARSLVDELEAAAAATHAALQTGLQTSRR
jgi:HPt (histidine-containing phosphotransfer) domain-containing protein